MRTPHRFAAGFKILAGGSGLILGLLLGVTASCAIDGGASADPVAGSASDATDNAAARDAADEDASEPVCTGWRYRCHARLAARVAGSRVSPRVLPSGFGPADLQSAYKIDPSKTATARPTVAIVDAFGYTALESDLAVYRSTYGLPPCTTASGCLKIVNQTGQAAPLPPNPPRNNDWTVETALDVDMASAACPTCNLLVLLADDDSGEGLFIAQNTAAHLGASVISNSWGGPETPSDDPATMALTESYLDHPGIAIFVAAGDDGFNDAGAGPDYPGTSAHVIAVGGTRLVRDASPRGWSETAWSRGGSACSLTIAKPAYQTASPCPYKATTDIAAVGDPTTGLAAYNAGNNGWMIIGGTSAAAPFVAAIFAATGNAAQSSGGFIAQSTSKLYDVTTGSNGTCSATDRLLCNAAVGWDGPTGYGTPNAAALAPPVATAPGGDAPSDDSGTLSGSCSTGGGRGGTAGAVLGAVVLGLVRRRKRA
jgi:subtilase family serine protease